MQKIWGLICSILMMCFGGAAMAQDWNGDWDSNFGQLRLLTNGDRLYGDYQERGVIEGRLSPDRRSARAFFVYNDGRWGTVQWRIAGDKLSGTWAWSHNGIPAPKSNNVWTALRTSARTSLLKFARQTQPKLPQDDSINQEPFRSWRFAATSPTPTPNNAPFSSLYGGYMLTGIGTAFSFDIDLMHYEGARAIAADIQIYLAPNGSGCPPNMHVEFCRELRRHADARGFVDTIVTGGEYIADGQNTVEIRFALSGETSERIIRLAGKRLTIHHQQRGFDYEGSVFRRRHICERENCSNQVALDLLNSPLSYIGIRQSNLIAQILALPNRIEQSHQSAGSSTTSNSGSFGAPSGPRVMLSDPWVILDETSENLGHVSISLGSQGLEASGVLRGMFDTAEDNQTTFSLVDQSAQAVSFDLVTYAGQSGESKDGNLVVELPSFASDVPKGTLIVEDQVFLIELVRPMMGQDPADVGDLPAIGANELTFGLRNVPPGKSLRLRTAPNMQAGVVGSIPANSRRLIVQVCNPELYIFDFSDQRIENLRRQLDGAWCQVGDGHIMGWVKGRFLEPAQ